MQNKTLLFLTAMAALLMACGSSAPPVKYTLSMDMVAQTPPEARAPVSEAFANHYEAELNLAHTRFMLDDVEHQLRIAKAKKTQAKQAQKIAKLEGARSKAVFKMGLVDAASGLLTGAKKDTSSLDHQIKYLKSQRSYLRKLLKQRKADVIHAATKFELAKAELAVERKSIPKGFKLARFTDQEKRAHSKSQKKAQAAKSAKTAAVEKERAWKKASK